MKLQIVLLVIIVVLMIGTVSAFTFDNVKVYNESSKEIIVKNGYGLGANLITHKLLYNTDFCFINCYAVIETTLSSRGSLIDGIEFKDIKNKLKSIDYSYKIKTSEKKEKIQIPEYKQICKEVSNHEREGEECADVVIGYKEEEMVTDIYSNYNGEELEPGVYTWKIEGKKDNTESIDWIVTSKGVKLTEWALWNTAEILGYWNMDYGSGNSINDTKGITNFTGFTTLWTTGKLSNGTYFNGTLHAYDQALSSIYNQTRSSGSISLWANITSSTPYKFLISGSQGIASSGTSWDLGINDAPGSNVLLGRVWVSTTSYNVYFTPTLGVWTHIVMTWNSSVVRLYENGVLVNSTALLGSLLMPVNVLTIGARQDVTNKFVGGLDEIGIWNRSLTYGEVMDLYNGGLGLPYGISAETNVTQYEDADPIGEYNTTTITLILNKTSKTESIGTAYANLFWNSTNMGYTTKTIIDNYSVKFEKTFAIPAGAGNVTGYPVGWFWNYNATNVTNANSTLTYQTIYNNALRLNFSESTNITMIAPNKTATVNNITYLVYTLTELGEGVISITFGNNQMVTYYNDLIAGITDYLQVFTPDLVQSFKVSSLGIGLENVLVKVYKVVNDTSYMVYSTYSDANGEGTINVDDGNLYIITAEKEGYYDYSKVVNIPEGNSGTLIINMESPSSALGLMSFTSDCKHVINEEKTCNFNAKLKETALNITIYINNTGIISRYSCLNTKVCAFYTEMNSSLNSSITSLYLDNTLVLPNIGIVYQNMSARSISISFPVATIRGNSTYRMLFYVITLLIGLFLAVSIEKKILGGGIWVFMIWMAVIAVQGFWEYWLVIIPLVMIQIGKIYYQWGK